MVLGCGSRAAYSTGASKLLTRSKGLTAIGIIGLCSVLYLTIFLPGFSVKTELARLLPKPTSEPQSQVQWDASPRRLIVFGDSWSDNGQYPIDAPPRDQMPSREEAQGKVWTDWLCSAVGRLCTPQTSN